MCFEQTSNAAESYYKVLLMHIKANRIKETCEARVRLIQAYLKLVLNFCCLVFLNVST